MPKKLKDCTCPLCQRIRKIRKVMAASKGEMYAFLLELAEELAHVEMDRDYYKSIVEGSWPQADKIIENARKRRKGK